MIIFFHLFIGIYYINDSCLKEGGVGGKPLNKPFKKIGLNIWAPIQNWARQCKLMERWTDKKT